jgi:AcrR family transcriptional regulator
MTQKAELTRQCILECALHLFATKGYEGTTMRDIATAAGCSLGLTYRYFTGKEDLVLVLYRSLAVELETYVNTLPPAPLADRFQLAVRKQLELMAPHRDTLAALFGTALNPESKAGVFGDNTADVRRQSRNIYLTVVNSAKDAPRESHSNQLATILYGMHLAVVLFWMIDRSRDTQRTYQLLTFLHDMLTLLRSLLMLPPVSKALERLAQIIGPILGDDFESESLL